MKRFNPFPSVAILLLISGILVMAANRGDTQESADQGIGSSGVGKLKMPESLRLRHEAFKAQFVRATKDRGKVGEAAREIEQLANAHFAKAKDVFPALGFLPQLADGKVTPQMADAGKIADNLRTSLPQIRREHRALVAGLKKIAEAARQEGKIEYQHFAERLIWHIQEEEEVLYPTVLLVDEVVKPKLEHK